MPTNQQLHFLKEKIQDLGSAIFFNLSDSVLKFPTALVSCQEVDDFGFMWFWVQKPRQSVREFENGFPVRLDFYRKGKSFFLQVTGNAWVVTDPEEITQMAPVAQVKEKAPEMVLVKVKMVRAEYHETQTAHAHSWWQNAVHSFFAWFRNSNGYTASSNNTFFPAS
jgi:general stress protein 26